MTRPNRRRVPEAVPFPSVVAINPRSFTETPQDDTPVSFVPMKAVDEETGRLDPSESRQWKDVRRGYTPFQEGDVVFAKITPCMENGKVAIARGLLEGRGAGTTELFVFRPNDQLDPAYLLYFLFNPKLRRDAKANMRGAAGQLRVPVSFFESLLIPMIPLSDQKRLVAQLDTHFERLRSSDAALERAIKNLRRYRAAVLRAACQGELVPTEATLAAQAGRHYEHAQELVDRGLEERRAPSAQRRRRRAPGSPATEGLGPLPAGWCWTTPEHVCEIVASGSTPPAHQMSSVGDVPFIKVYNLTFGGCVDFTIKPTFIPRSVHEGLLARSKTRPGDVLMNIVGPPLGKVSIVQPDFPEWNINQAIVVFRPTGAIMNELLAAWFRAPPILSRLERTKKATAGQFNLQVTTCRNLPIPLPPKREQLRIVAELRRRLSIIDDLELKLIATRTRGDRLRQSILTAAFYGVLPVKD
jgi:type I restriction enzyme, S subunit